MELEEIRNKYQCDEGRTFAQWKEWVRKNKPSQAETHIVKAVAPNGSKYERLIGGYTDAQNTAFDLVAHGYKNVKMFKSVNAGPMKLLRNFSAPLHGAKFKDSDVSTDAQDDKKFFFQVFTRNGKLISKIKAPDTISTSIATRLAEQESKKFKKNWYKCQIVDQNGRSYETYYNKVPSYNGTRELAQKNMDAVDEIRQKYQEDKLSITSNGFANGSGVLKKDTRKGLKPFEVAFIVKGKDGKPFKTVRSKMAASLEEAKRWANQESRKYNGVTKVDVKEFKDSVDSADSVDFIRQKYAKDAAFGVKVKGNEKGSERLTMEKVFKELSPAPAWKKVKKGNTIVIRTNINGKDQDVVTIKYFNPNVVAMTPKGGAANMVALKDVTVMCSKLGVEGRRSYNDSADSIEMIKAKYSEDAMVSKSEIEKKKYTQFFVNGEDINGKVLRIPQRRFKKFEDAVRVAKSLQNANTRHVFVEGGWDNNQVEPKALYDWRNPKVK